MKKKIAAYKKQISNFSLLSTLLSDSVNRINASVGWIPFNLKDVTS